MSIVLTEKAASEFKRICAEQEDKSEFYLRLKISGGGCSGFANKLDIDPEMNPEKDELFEQHGVKVVVDKRSLLYATGSTIDFHEGINARGFKVTNPGAKSVCGCGSSFSM